MHTQTHLIQILEFTWSSEWKNNCVKPAITHIFGQKPNSVIPIHTPDWLHSSCRVHMQNHMEHKHQMRMCVLLCVHYTLYFIFSKYIWSIGIFTNKNTFVIFPSWKLAKKETWKKFTEQINLFFAFCNSATVVYICHNNLLTWFEWNWKKKRA